MSPLELRKSSALWYIHQPAFLALRSQPGYVAPKAGPLNREYDIFERLPDGTDLWRDFVVGLEQARRKLQELASQSKNEFYAIHTPTKEITARVNVPKP
jgi:hypothetical protein